MSSLHRIASYVPRLIQQRLTTDGFKSEPCRHSEHSVLLLGDIVGSTRIVEQVTQHGSLAVESLTGTLNSVFANFVDHIYDHGGDVLFIAGDAFLCFWPGHEFSSEAEPVRLATSAALRIQHDMHEQVDGFGNPVQFRLGIAAGELTRVFVGGINGRWEPFLAGEALEHVIEAERDASAGKVRLSEKARTILQADLQTSDLPNIEAELDWQNFKIENILPTVTPNIDNQPAPEERLLTPFLPTSVARRKLVASNAWLSEVRTVTVLMAGLPHLDLQTSEAVGQLHNAVQSFQSISHRFEASMRVDADDKGAMLFAVFGLPPLAHEDDAIRAIHAAWELTSALTELGITPGIGLATGRALCAPLGNDRRREFMVRSNVTNRAARLMHATGNEIACDEPTVIAARGLIEFETLPAHLVKGLSDALSVQRPVGVREAVNRAAREIIGRQRYLSQLKHVLSLTRDKHVSHTMLINGEAGIGKSSLVNAIALYATNSGIRVLRASADSVEQTSPWYAVRGVFAEMFGLTISTDTQSSKQRVHMQMERYPTLLPLTPLLGPVVGIEFEQTEATRHLEGEARANRTLELLVQLVENFVQGSLSLLIMEDAHWFDSRSAEFLHSACQALPSSTIVVTQRPTDNNQIDWEKIDNCERIDLESFSQEDIEQLIARRVGVDKVPDELSKLVHARSGGNPFFAEQIVHAMIDNGVLGRKFGQFELDAADAIAIPPTVEGMVLGRLDRLSEQQAVLLKMASIAGQNFSPDAVLAIAPVPINRSNADEDFAGLERAGFLKTNGQDLRLEFRHAITREVTYGSMTHAQQVAGHRAYAEWLETHQNSAWINEPLMALHWRAGENPSRALELLESAAEHALYGGAYKEALALYTEAKELGSELNISSDTLNAARWEKGLGTARYFLGDMQQSREHLETVVRILDRPIPRTKASATPVTLAGVYSQWRHRKRNEISQVRCNPKDKQMYDMLIDTYKTLGQLYYLEGEPAELLVYLSVRGLNIGEIAGPSSAFACILTNMIVTSSLIKLDRAADWYSQRAYTMVKNQDCRGAAPYVSHIDALRHAQHGNWPTALEANENAHRLIETLGDRTLTTEVAAVRAALLLCSGDIKSARPVIAIAREEAIKSNNQQFLCWALLDGVEIELATDQFSAAADWLNQALQIPTDPLDLSSRLDKHRAEALLRLREGSFDAAKHAAAQVTQIISAHPPNSYYFMDFYASAIEVLIECFAQGPSDAQLRGSIEKSLKRLKRLSTTFLNVKPRYWLLKGQFEVVIGMEKDALAHMNTAYIKATELNMHFEQARAQAARAVLGPGSPDDQQQAIQIFEELGQIYLAQKLRKKFDLLAD